MDEPTPLQAAAERKRAVTLQRASTALRELATEGADITFQQVARRAAVSRQWLYQQPELRGEIEQLRQRPKPRVPVRERSSEASLHQRLRTVMEENRTLRAENRELKHELTLAYGAQRARARRRLRVALLPVRAPAAGRAALPP